MSRIPPSPLPGLTDDQRALFSATAEILAGNAPLGRSPARRAADLVDLGMPVMLVAEKHGGMGFGPVELAGVAFELGQHAEDTAMLDMTIAAGLVSRFGDPVHTDHLPRLATGDERWSLRLPTHVYPDNAATATRILVEHGQSLYLAAASACTFEPQVTIDPGRRIARVGYAPRPEEFVTRESGALPYANALGAVAYGAYLVGLARRMLVDAVEYANSREQFGTSIGSFQAVAHRLADAFVLVDSSVVAAFGAAAQLVAGDLLPSSVARAYCGDAVRRVNVYALQVFGGIGFTEEHHLHRWLKRAKALEAAFGAPYEHRMIVAQATDQRASVDLRLPPVEP
jgi:alkylation response protein AidB-like acyl-CoA dehydrogenase